MPHEPRNSSSLLSFTWRTMNTESSICALDRAIFYSRRSRRRMQIKGMCGEKLPTLSLGWSHLRRMERWWWRRRPLPPRSPPIDLNGPESACGRAINSPLHRTYTSRTQTPTLDAHHRLGIFSRPLTSFNGVLGKLKSPQSCKGVYLNTFTC
jgi:hypothetical protein